MNYYEVINWIETKRETQLSELQKAILKGSWEDKKYEEIANSLRYNLQYVKDVGYQLWELISEVCKEKITKKTFRTKLEQRCQNLTPPTHRRDWGDAPDVPVFFGRTEELATLEQWIIQECCRLVVIVGIGGIGKTQLSVKLGKGGIGKTDLSLKLAKGIQHEFEYVIWRSLLNAPPAGDILTDLIKFLSNQQETEFANTQETQISRLLHYLQAHRCLLILDNVETILQKGDSLKSDRFTRWAISPGI
ncbi:NB-ARC domain-containing protein [Fischerella sp. PCC 9605]|uniref:NB-ARC domain-containing protein n=1 Tax=Fischerella sp. PCC 9605 TaxID=1173024 RepID=UPI0004BCAF1A|nr:NB-ARC domain-containing protein [Fischerella sp. PCC 9605]